VARSRFSAFGACFVALVVQIAAASQKVTPLPPPADDVVRRALAAGDYVRAETDARTDMARVETRYGPESREYARALDMLVEALLKNGRGGEPQTPVLARRALALRERLSGQDVADVAASVHNLGAVLTAQGDFASAIALHRRGLRIREAAAADGIAIAESMEHLAVPLMRLAQFPEARSLLEGARTRRESNAAIDAAALANTLELLGTLNRLVGDYASALSVLDSALEMRRRVVWEHPDTASTTYERAFALYLMGQIPASQRTWNDALAMFERTLRPGHPAIGITQRALAIADSALGQLGDAMNLRRAAVAAAEAALGPCDPERSFAYNDLAISLQWEGDYAGARRYFARKLERITQCTGTAATDAYATTLYNQADLAAEIGDLAEAERLYQRAIDVWSKALGPSHPFVSVGLDALARTVSARGQFTRAQTIYERALALRIRTLGPNHPRVAYTLVNIARNLDATGNRPRALEQIARALAIYDAAGSVDEPDNYALTLALRGSIEAGMHRYGNARSTFGGALAARERIFGASHPLTAESRADVAAIDFALGNYADALGSALNAERVGRDHLVYTIRYLPERHASTYAAKRPRGLDLALSILAAGKTNDAAVVLDSAARSRGAILDELADRARVDTTTDPELRLLTQTMTTARARFATLMMRSLGDSASVSRALLDQARAEKEDAERALAERSASARAEQARTRIGLAEIRSAMPARSALISFVRYTRSLPRVAESASVVRTPSYLAFVMRADATEIRAVPIGSAQSIDGLVAAWRRYVAAPAAAEGGGDVDAGTKLRRAVWDPVAKDLAGVSTVFIVPDGELNLVNFAALPVGRATYLVETDLVLHYLSTERDLVSADEVESEGGLLAVGGPALETASTPRQAASRNGECAPFGAMAFADLPGARAEAREIAALWRGAPGDALVLTGRDATEAAVKRAVPRRRVIHFATHGFFLGTDCRMRPAGSRAVGAVVVSSPASAANDGENALLRAGLLLAGANRARQAKPGEDDGILTAEEVAGMDLRGTEWAVLSACDTGVGEIRAGEGVFGLRRAFQIAGARTVIMSLWSVDDEATRRWMRALYQSRLVRRTSTAVAVRDATIGLLRDRRSRGESAHPFYWAAFVAAGNWR
jgi:CHAT domain-containing protein/tetratricopeptide (TPR) repeat protein